MYKNIARILKLWHFVLFWNTKKNQVSEFLSDADILSYKY